MDSVVLELTRQCYHLFDTDSSDAFFATTKKLKQIYMERGQMDSYYVIRHNEILYESDHGQPYQAIKEAEKLKEELEKDESSPVALAYLALGNIYESRGNYRLAMRHYQDALNTVKANDTIWAPQIYGQIVSATLTRDTKLAWKWNERLGANCTHPYYEKLYLGFKGQIHFFRGEKEQFFATKQKLDELPASTSSVYTFGSYVIALMEAACLGKYEEALQMLEQDSQDYDNIRRFDIRIRIYEMMGLSELALKETYKRRDMRDSLNNDIILANISDINNNKGMAKLNEKVAKEHQLWMGTIIVLLMTTLGLFFSRYFTHRRHQKKIESQKDLLEVALEEAKESDRRKGMFIQHISHEIRTPLNIINGYIQIVANPEIELEKEERASLLRDIDVNTMAITDIVDDLLEISQDDNKERYPKNDIIPVNALCQRVLRSAEKSNMGRLKLCFRTNLTNDFTIKSNKEGIRRILRQLLNNSMKFTKEGQIELCVYGSADKNVYFTVTDTGSGIPEDMHEKVFELFYKLDDFKPGLGIGMPMSRKIAELLDGTLSVGKHYQDGACMVLCIPMNNE